MFGRGSPGWEGSPFVIHFIDLELRVAIYQGWDGPGPEIEADRRSDDLEWLRNFRKLFKK